MTLTVEQARQIRDAARLASDAFIDILPIARSSLVYDMHMDALRIVSSAQALQKEAERAGREIKAKEQANAVYTAAE